MQNIKRANEKRTFSERVIDKYLRKIEKDTTLEKLEFKFSNSPKKIKPNEKNDVKDQIKPTQTQNVVPNEALSKILKHMGNAQKAPKALSLISQLIETNIHELHHLHLLETIFQIMKYYHYFVDLNSKKTIYTIIKKIEDYGIIEKLQKKEKLLFSAMSKSGEYLFLLNTDDSYQFHNSVKKVNEYFDEIYQEYISKANFSEWDDQSEYDDDLEEKSSHQIAQNREIIINDDDLLGKIHDKLTKNKEFIPNSKKKNDTSNIITTLEEENKEKEITPTTNYIFQISEELENILDSYEHIFEYKKKVVHGLIIEVNKMYSREWAKSSINILLNKIFYQKDVFSEEQIEILDKIMKEMNQKKQKNINQNLLRNNLDEKIMGNPLISKNEVSDARTIVLNENDGLGAWSARQCGL